MAIYKYHCSDCGREFYLRERIMRPLKCIKCDKEPDPHTRREYDDPDMICNEEF